MILSTMAAAFRNSDVMTVLVECITLWVAHMDGYAGVMIGIR